MEKNKLKELLKEKGGSIANVGKTIGIPDTTIKGILSRGIDVATVKNIKAIADYLNITIDSIVYDVEPKEIKIQNIENKLKKLSDRDLSIIENLLDSMSK